MKKLVLAAALLVVNVAFADSYAKCVACHGANGEKVALGKSKIIKDMTKDEITKALKGYKDGTYGGAMKALMKAQVASLGDADIKSISDKIGK